MLQFTILTRITYEKRMQNEMASTRLFSIENLSKPEDSKAALNVTNSF